MRLTGPVAFAKDEVRSSSKVDVVAGLTNAVTNIPDAMANAVLAGLNPIQGLYAIMVGTPTASVSTGSQLMTVAVTGSMALIVGEAFSGVSAAETVPALVVLAVLVGAIQMAMGALRTGSLVRFVSNAVLKGFMLGVAINIVLSQFGDITGFGSQAGGRVARALDTLLHPMGYDPQVVVTSVITAVVVLGVERTKAREFAFLASLIVATAAVRLAGWTVPDVASLGGIPSALPRITLPDPSMIGRLLVPAVSLSVVGLIQGAGVSKGIPNRDGTYPSVDRDFFGQGLGNIASGLFGGMPVGGSVSSTSLIVQMGARTRLANFLVGPFIALVVLFLSGLVELVPLSTLATLLLIVGIRAVDVPSVSTVWYTSVQSRAVMLVTFVATLVMPLQYAVLLGVGLSVVQYVYRASLDVRVVELHLDDGAFVEQEPSRSLRSGVVTVIDIYGSVFYAGAEVIRQLLPSAVGSSRPAVVLRLRGRTDVGSTFLTLLERYRAEVDAAGGILMLAGVGPQLMEQLRRTGALEAVGSRNVFEAQATLTASLTQAVSAAQDWLESHP